MPFAIGPVTQWLLPAPLVVRAVLGIIALAPLGFLMGVMFPKGIAHLSARAPELVPWAWGINGVASVISAVASALLALSFGFRFVVLAGALGYALASALAPAATAVAGSQPSAPGPVNGTKATSPRLVATSSPASSVENIHRV